jgi:hypothetical protein
LRASKTITTSKRERERENDQLLNNFGQAEEKITYFPKHKAIKTSINRKQLLKYPIY